MGKKLYVGNLPFSTNEQELRSMPQIRTVLSYVGGGFLGGVNSAGFFVQLQPHEERTFGWSRLLHWPPWGALKGNYTQFDVQQEIRKRLRSIPDVRIAIRNADEQKRFARGARCAVD